MAKQYKYELYEHETALEEFLQDPISEGFKPISIYRVMRHDGFDVVVWWEIEDAHAQA
jgi:hypothetical protein